MKKYNLYLDESGDFKNDKAAKNKNWNPSLIGGVLFDSPCDKKKTIFDDNLWHSTELSAEETFDKFLDIDKLNPIYVIFSNEERIKVINNNLTYQNIITEGIIQLLQRLSAEHGEVFLDIYISRRIIIGDDEKRINGKRYPVVQKSEYEERLTERLIMANERAYANGRYPDKKPNWKITLGNAKKDAMLKMADVVCNTYLTRNTKYRDKKYEKIRQVYDGSDRVYLFSVVPSVIQNMFHDAMAEGRIGEAVTILCQLEDKALVKKYMDEVTERFQEMKRAELVIQYKFIEALTEYYINVERDFPKSLTFIDNLLEYFVPAVKEKQLERDLYFHKLTVYTHMGNIKKSLECEKICDEILENSPNSLDMADYQIRYGIRKIASRFNQFDFEAAGRETRLMVQKCEEVKELLSIVSGHEGVYLELGKAYSNQVQHASFVLRNEKGLYQEAVAISEKAIHEMEYGSRQYQDRVKLETEAGEYDKAFLALLLAAGIVKPEEADLLQGTCAKLQNEQDRERLCRELAGGLACRNESEFLLMNYIRLMGEGSLGQWDFSEKMYQSYSNAEVCRELTEGRTYDKHPYEIIYWKLATYYAQTQKQWNASMSCYEKAMKICYPAGGENAEASDDLTLEYIGFAVELERYAFALKRKDKISKLKKDLIKHYRSLEQKTELESMKSIFGDFSPEEEDWKYYYEMSRRITY